MAKPAWRFMDAIEQFRQRHGKYLTADQHSFLDRLGSDARVNRIWDKLEIRARRTGHGDADAVAFVATLVTALSNAEVVDILKSASRTIQRAGQERLKRLIKDLRKTPLCDIASVLEANAEYFRPFATLPTVGQDLMPRAKRETRFAKSVSNTIHEMSGYWADDDVGVLAEIAFLNLSTVADLAEKVREARKRKSKA